jgi:hypothetical protein
LNFGIWIRDDGWPPSGAYRIKVTIRYKVRRRERCVEKENFRKGLKGLVHLKFSEFTTNRFLRTYFSLDRGIIGCPLIHEDGLNAAISFARAISNRIK